MKQVITILFFLLSVSSFAQKPQSGVYKFKYFDLEYNKFHGTCKVIIRKDSIKVFAVEDCHRKAGELISEGTLKKKNNRWIIVPFKHLEDEGMDEYIDVNKKIFYTY